MRYEELSVGILRLEHGIQGEEPNVPASGTGGYMPGEEFLLRNPSLGMSIKWVNMGTVVSCLFVPVGPVMGYGVNAAGGPFDCVNGAAATTLGQDLVIPTDIAFSGHAVSDDNDQIISVIAQAGKNNILSTGSADPLVAHDYVWAALRNKCIPTWDIVAAGTYDAVAGDDATIAIAVTGVLVGDIAFANFTATDDTDTIASVACTAGVVTITENADPVTDHSYSYVVFRPRGTFKPSHYIAYAGKFTTVGGAAAEAFTVTGALATDIPIIVYHTTDDTDSILKVVMAANGFTVTFSANPAAAHGISYMLLRAYA